MRDFLKFLHTIEWPVQLIGWGTFAVWVFKALVLDQYPGHWPLYDFGRVMEGIFSALISGYVFYILFALWPEYKAKSSMQEYFAGIFSRVIGDCIGVLAEVNHTVGTDMKFSSASEDEVKTAFNLVLITSRPRFVVPVEGKIEQGSWLQFVEYRGRRSKASIASLFTHGRFIEPRILALLASIDDAPFYGAMAGASSMPMGNTDLGVWGPLFFKYLKDCRALAIWYDEQHFPGRGRIQDL